MSESRDNLAGKHRRLPSAARPVPLKSGQRFRLKPGNGKRRKTLRVNVGVSAGNGTSRLAMLSVVATLIVAVLSAATTLHVTTLNARNANQQADQEFKRTNQRVAYAEFVSQMVAAHTSINRLASSMVIDARYLPAKEVVRDSLAQIADTLTKVNDKYSVVLIIGSEESVDHADKWLKQCTDGLAILTSAIVVRPENYLVDQAKARDVVNRMVQAAADEQEFLDSARKDLKAFG